MVARALALSIAVWALHAPIVAADCRFSGDGVVTDVTPVGTALHFGLAEEAEISLEGTHARVRGVRPVAFEGRAEARDVRVAIAAPRRLLGVLVSDAGTPVSIRRVDGGRARVLLETRSVRATFWLRCDELAFGPVAPSQWTSGGPHLVSHEVRARRRFLRLFPSAVGGRPVTLRSHETADELPWPDLMVLERRGTRIHVSAPLSQDVGIDAWIEQDDVEILRGIVSTCGCGPADTALTGCGYGSVGETYRGAAHARAGTTLSDEDGTIWGTLVIDADLSVVITVVPNGAPGPETVAVERIPGLVPSPCSASGIRIDRASVTLSERTD